MLCELGTIGKRNSRPEARGKTTLGALVEEHRPELLGGVDDELTEGQEAEIVRRRDQALAHPELLESWDGVLERVRQQLHEFRSQTASSR